MDDQVVEVQVNVCHTSTQTGRCWQEVPKLIYDQGYDAVLKYLENQDDLGDINWDCEDSEGLEIMDWEDA